ncbi:MAG: glycosyl transferase family 51 [Microbacterium sp. SCN 70-200]|uniref:transglycosylase domain-containing protein n=1 Tax=unclassified Microbacterium TaxID=2609290 RepID=UPI0008686BFA|nr:MULTISPECIES: transglycosylase domain-containing protein [unclassified Microbacterium]MBN9213613.1 transglycosylase domain-containing protein [Microbacterium sp.]ODT42240.1 MAG: glycosyl transferase family 51 [Microbacterium sp. SCN 70-200]OJV79131.1 MAG: glycosyl transferase family 51 [Microbacterium sp. 70-16]
MPHVNRTATGVLGGLAGLVGLSVVAGVLVTATVTPALAVSGYAATSALDSFDNMPSVLEIDPLMLPTEIYRKDSAGNDVLMAEFYDQNRIPVTYDEVNPVMYEAMVSSEDKNFYTHGGVDFVGTLSALVGNASSGGNRGGSTITQQYVKNVLQQNCETQANGDQDLVDACYAATTVNSGTEGYQRKLQEMRYAIQVEKQYSKEEILLGYLNITNFGGTVYGIGAAAEHYFGVSAADLTIAQAATIAGMVQEPNTFRIDQPGGTTTDKAGNAVNGEADGYSLTLDRRNYVLGRMLEDGKISQAEYDEAYATPITPNIVNRQQGCQMASGAEFFCEYVVSIIKSDPAFGDEDERALNLRRGGFKVYTTLDPDLQQTANDAISIVPATVSYMDLGSSGVQVEVGTGRILSMVQNRPYSATGTEEGKTPVNYNVREANGGSIGHSAGSTYKVFSLLNWLQQGRSVNEVINGRIGVKKVQTCDGATQSVPADNTGVAGHIGNFENSSGYTGTIYNFTRDSLNSGFLAMAEQLSVCSTNEVAGQMGVTWGDGTPLTSVPSWSTDPANAPYNVLGSSAVAPLDMAEAYAAIAANGVLCQPKSIDKALDADGNDITPQTTCNQALTTEVASTAAYTLVGVMSGTGVGARIGDGVPVFGKTGIHQYEQTWMDGSSTKVATVVWVGNATGAAKLNLYRENGWQLSRIRNAIWPAMQGAANAKYGGDNFPDPAAELTKRVLTDLPSVIGMTVDQATTTLEAAGFSVTVGDAVDGVEAAGTIVQQDPAAGKVGGGTTVTINPSNGNGLTVPAVSGTLSSATQTLRSAGFSDISSSCTQRDSASDEGTVTGTDPSAGTVVSRSASITINYQAKSCGNSNRGNNNGNNG